MECINARDFGYEYVYAYSNNNIFFDDVNNNFANKVYHLDDFLHTGGSCGYPGGCNNGSPRQDFLYFSLDNEVPASLGVKLWKQNPENINAPADLYYVIKIQ